MAKKTVAAKKRVVKIDGVGQLHVMSSFNNVIVTMANGDGLVISWSSAGKMGFKGSKKATPYAAQTATTDAVEKAKEYGLQTAKVQLVGPGVGREASLRVLQGSNIVITSIEDMTYYPHNGCRPPKRRRN